MPNTVELSYETFPGPGGYEGRLILGIGYTISPSLLLDW